MIFSPTRNILRCFLFVLLPLLLTGCPGGGSSGSNAPTLTLEANLSQVSVGSSPSVRWQSTNTDACVASGTWSGDEPAQGDQPVKLTVPGDHVYTLTCYGVGGSIRKSVTINAVTAPTLTIYGDTDHPFAGSTFDLHWASDADSCIASGAWSGELPPAGSETVVARNGTSDYVITCSQRGTSVQSVFTASPSYNPLTINVTPNLATAQTGRQVTVSWTSPGDTCRAEGTWFTGEVGTSGERTVTVVAGQNYLGLECAGGGNSWRATRYLYGGDGSVSLTATPTDTVQGTRNVLTWNSSYVEGCTASGAWSGNLPLSGSWPVIVPSTGTNTYTVTCGNPLMTMNTVKASVTVTGMPYEATLSVYPPRPVAGDEMTLHWSTNGGGDCTASGDWNGALDNAGRKTLANLAAGPHAMTLSCSNGYGSDTTSVSATASAATAPKTTAAQVSPVHAGAITFASAPVFPDSSLWSASFPRSISYPLIADGSVFVLVAGEGSGTTYQSPSLYALNEADGSVRWGPIALSGSPSPSGYLPTATYDGGKVFVVDQDGYVTAFLASSGAQLWLAEAGEPYAEPVSAPPSARYGILYIRTLYALVALDEANGTSRWTRRLGWPSGGVGGGSPSVSSAAVYDDTLGNVQAFDPQDGTLLWQRKDTNDGNDATVPVANGQVYAPAWQWLALDSTHLFDAITGEDAGTLTSRSMPAVSGTALYTVNQGQLHAVDLGSGQETWTFQGDGTLTGVPIVVNDNVIVGSSSGQVFALDSNTGSQRWAGTAATGINALDYTGATRILTALAAGEGLLVVPGDKTLTAWSLLP